MPRKFLFGLVAAAAATLGLVVGVLLLAPNSLSITSGTLLPTPRPVPDFALTGSDGAPYTRAQWLGHWNVLFVGFTSCPDICPTTFTTLKNVARALGPDAERVRFTLISVDPERDTPQRLQQYVQYFDPRFTAATGSNAELDKLAAALSFAYVKVPGATAATYTMDHSSALILVNPQGELAGFFTPPLHAQALAADLKSILKNSPP